MDQTQPDLDENTVFLNIPGKAGRTVKPGDLLGDNYRLIDLIGRGGMGVVYRCRHLIIEQDYALKILSPDQVNEQSWQRFQVEGQAIAKLDHPNIVKIFNMGVAGQDCPYYVMELLPGESLETYIESHGPLSWEEALDIFAQLASGLSYAHSKGIIHRDIKPSNIILQKDASGKNSIKIVDFGLAKLVGSHSPAGQSLTSPGEVFGSPFYMSPEQGMGTEVDARSDIYSLGCTLFKTLTGQPPFCCDSAFQTIMMHQSQPAPSLAVAGQGMVFPPALEDLVQKMLAKRPEDRYQSVDQISHDISRLQQGKTLVKSGLSDTAAKGKDAAPLENKPSSLSAPWPLKATAFLLLIIVSFAAFHFFESNNHLIWGTTSGASQGPIKAGIDPSSANQNTEKLSTHPKDAQLEKTKAEFSTFQHQDTGTIQIGRKRFLQFHFPDTAIGLLQNSMEDKRPAKGIVAIPDDRPIVLKINWQDHRSTWDNPSILRQLGPTDINILYFDNRDDDGAALEGTVGHDLGEKSILDMLAIARTWTHVDGICFSDCTVSTNVLAAVQKFPHIVRFTLKGCENTGAELAQYPVFLRNLQELNVSGLNRVDPILIALSNSQNLTRLIMDGTTPSPKAIAALSTCPNLYLLTLEGGTLSDGQLDALGRLPHMQELSVSRAHLNPDTLLRLPNLKNLTRLTISQRGWTPEQIQGLKQALPKNCRITQSKDANFGLGGPE